ncbi:MAG: glycosyltransferase family 2 protein [Methylococcaceae bacterium]|nr:glycosyltransferase family 2 protein [Methylococcaceae bacterium]
MLLQKSSSNCDVVIVNYNAGKLLSECVFSVFMAGVTSAIVVDNGSEDGSLERLERDVRNEQLSIIRNDKNLGFAAGCNIGARASSSGTILFLNPDSVLATDALAQMLSVLQSSPDVGMVGGLLCNPDGSEQPGGRRVFPTPKRAFMRAFGLSRLSKFLPEFFSDFLMHKEPLPTKPIEVEAISGACMLVKREAMDDVGLWDDDYFLHCEDLDWCMRFKLKAWKVMFVPGAKVTHAWGACSRSRPIFVEWHKHKGMMRFYRKFFKHQYPGVLMCLVAAGIWLRFSLVVAYYTTKRVGRTLGT